MIQVVTLLFTLMAALPLSAAARATDWKPIDPAHLAMKEPRIEASADAEALFCEVRVSDGIENGVELSTTFHHYLRVKIFTNRGRETFATVDIPSVSGMDVKDVAARTIRQDGSIVELKKSDIYRRTILKADGLKFKALSFAVPAIEPGVIVEYSWREVYRDSLAANLRLPFSRAIPAHVVRYYIRPLAIPGLSMIAWPFNGRFAPPERQPNGYHMVALHDVPADAQEPYGPPASEQRPWMFIGYEPNGRSKSADFYEQFGRELHEEYSKRSKPNDAIRALAAAATAGATTDADRLAALARTAREKIRRIDVDTADPADLRKARATSNASDALKRGIGTADDVVLLRAAEWIPSLSPARCLSKGCRSDIPERRAKGRGLFSLSVDRRGRRDDRVACRLQPGGGNGPVANGPGCREL